MKLQSPPRTSGHQTSPAWAYFSCSASVAMGGLQMVPLAAAAMQPMYAYALAMAQHRVAVDAQQASRRPYPPRLNLN